MDIKRIKSICDEHGYVFEQFGSNPRLILIGELHHSEKDFGAQEELIKVILPSAVLYETYDPELHDSHRLSETWCENSSLYKIRRMKDLSNKFNFELLPGDISSKEQSNLEAWLNETLLDMKWSNKICGRTRIFSRLSYAGYYSRLIAEPLMGIRLQNALDKNKGKIMGIFGTYHLRPDSQIHSVLRLKFPPLGESFTPKNSSLSIQDYIIVNQDK